MHISNILSIRNVPLFSHASVSPENVSNSVFLGKYSELGMVKSEWFTFYGKMNEEASQNRHTQILLYEKDDSFRLVFEEIYEDAYIIHFNILFLHYKRMGSWSNFFLQNYSVK